MKSMSEPIFVAPVAELSPVLSLELLPELRASALRCLLLCDPALKVLAVAKLDVDFKTDTLALDAHASLMGNVKADAIPGRPSRPELVLPKTLKHRSMRTEEGRAALIHALAHIEFNAINLALDAVCRFSAMPDQYYIEWLSVAVEEAQHFGMLARHLQTLGYAYGDFPGHNSMWEMAEKTKDDILARMALVPRTLEARGLDATPAVRAKIAQAGDLAAAAILDIILREEVGHVAIGNHWYNWLCKQRQLEPIAAFANLVVQYQAPVLRGPFNLEARRAAGFSEDELLVLQSS